MRTTANSVFNKRAVKRLVRCWVVWCWCGGGRIGRDRAHVTPVGQQPRKQRAVTGKKDSSKPHDCRPTDGRMEGRPAGGRGKVGHKERGISATPHGWNSHFWRRSTGARGVAWCWIILYALLCPPTSRAGGCEAGEVTESRKASSCPGCLPRPLGISLILQSNSGRRTHPRR